MKLNSYLAVILCNSVKFIGSFISIFGYGATGAIIGYTSASVVQGVISLIFLYFFIFRKLPVYKINKSEIIQTLKSLLSYGVPLGIGAIVGNLGGPDFLFSYGFIR